LSSICLQNVGIPEIGYHAMAAAARRAPSCSAARRASRRFDHRSNGAAPLSAGGIQGSEAGR